MAIPVSNFNTSRKKSQFGCSCKLWNFPIFYWQPLEKLSSLHPDLHAQNDCDIYASQPKGY